jgi:hypothetical protein
MAMNENTPNTRPSISALARQHGVHRRTVARRLKNGWEPTVKLVEQDQGVRRDAHPPARCEVDLVQLRHDIHEWAQLHRKVSQLKAQARRNEKRSRISDPVSRFVCLGIGVSFFAMLAVAAVN